MEQEFIRYVGIDWGSQAHEVVVVDEQGEKLARRSVKHSGRALSELASWLLEQAPGGPDSIAVGIEVPRGAIVETLLERGFSVFAINPKQLDRFRDRYSMSGAKDDHRDAFVLAQTVRSDRARYRTLSLDDPFTARLRELSRGYDEVRDDTLSLANQLRDFLSRYFPQVLELSPSAGDPWVWELLSRASKPKKAKLLRTSTLESILRSHRIRKWSAKKVRSILREPPLVLAPGAADALAFRVELLLPRLRLAHEQQMVCKSAIKALLDEASADEDHPQRAQDVRILRSLKGMGDLLLSAFLTDAHDALAARNYKALRTLSGVAPVTKQSGKSLFVKMRHGCSKRLRFAAYHWAKAAIINDPAARSHYDKLRGTGHGHARALRGVADRMMRIMVALLRTGTTYDPNYALSNKAA